MSLVCFSGDWHGSTSRAKLVFDYVKEKPVDAIIQLGDFGIWPGGDEFLNNVKRMAAKCHAPFLWIDGNHEDFDQIDAFCEGHSKKTPIEVSDNFFYLPRGCRFKIDGVRFGVLGGAFSIDHARRVPGQSVWPEQEQACTADVDRLGKDPLDILLTHDAPERPLGGGVSWISQVDVLRAQDQRVLIKEAIRNTHPKLLIHGHWHYRYDSGYNSTQILGLASNMEPFAENTVLLDTGHYRVLK